MKNKIVSILVYGTLLSVFSYAEQGSANIIDQMSKGGFADNTSNAEVNPYGTSGKIYGYEEATFEHLKEVERDQGQRIEMAVDLAGHAYDVEGYQKEREREESERRLAMINVKQQAENERNIVRYGYGYCYLNDDIIVERLATYAYLDCDFNEPIGRASLAVSMVPEFYAKALVGNPLYVITRDNTRIPIQNGVVMTKDKNSVNIANIVNDRLLEKIMITGSYKSLGIVAQQTQAYLDAKTASRTTSATTITTGDNPVVINDTQTAPPKYSDYWATATVQVVSELAKIVGENMVENLNYTFKANKGSIYYVDVQFSDDKNMEGYKIQTDNIVKREPVFINTEHTNNIKLETIPVLNNHGKEKIEFAKEPIDINQYNRTSK